MSPNAPSRPATPSREASAAPLPAIAKRTPVPLGDLRRAGGLMLAAAAALPLVPGRPGLACPLRTLTGIPCPLCGMPPGRLLSTTAVVPTSAGPVPARPG